MGYIEVKIEKPRVEVDIPRKCPQDGQLLHYEGSGSVIFEEWRPKPRTMLFPGRVQYHLKLYHCDVCGHLELVLPIFKEGQ